MRKLYLFVTLLLTFTSTGYAQQHGLDPMFNDSGIVIPAVVNQINASSEFYDVCLQQDGKILTTGYGTGMRTMRFKTDGKPDSSFATNGMFTYNIFSFDGFGSKTSVLPDSNILVAGTIGSNNFGVLKLKPNGTLDSSFGNNGLAMQFGGDYGVSGITIQSNGCIIVAGTAGLNYAMVRFLPNGTPDSSFGNNGRVATYGGTYSVQCNAIALQADGKILLTGRGWYNGDVAFMTIRYKINGDIDSSFGIDGRAYWQPGTAAAHDIKIQSNGKILLSGGAYSIAYPDGAEVAMRLNTDGSLDTSFNHTGHLIVSHDGYSPLIYVFGCRMVLMTDGRILLGGVVEDSTFNTIKHASLWRCLPNGKIDSGFCINGSQVLDFSLPGSGINGLTIQPDGKILTAGFCNWLGGNENTKMTIARFLPNGNVGIRETPRKQPTVTIFPNPANNIMTISANTPIVSVRLTSINGTTTYRQPDKPTVTTQINTQDLPTGLYFVLISMQGDTHTTQKILITH